MTASPALGLERRWRTELGDCVTAIAMSASGDVAAAGLSGEVVLGRAGALPATIAVHAGGALCVAWSPDGRRLASGGQDGRVHLHAVDGGLLADVDLGAGWVNHVAWNRDGDVLAVAAGRKVVFLTADGQPRGEPIAHGSTVSALVAAPRSHGFLSACYGGVHMLTVGPATPARRLEWKGSILCLSAARSGKWVVTGSQDAAMHVWRETGEQLYMSGYPSKVTTVGFSDDSRWLFSNSGEAVCVWPFEGKGPRGRTPSTFERHRGGVSACAWLDDRPAPTLASVGADGALRLWDVPSQGWLATHECSEPLERVATGPGQIVIGGRRGALIGLVAS